MRSEKLEKAMASACRIHPGITREVLMKRSKSRPYVYARWLVWTILRETTDWSYPMIGRVTGGFDHSTIVYAVHETRRRLGPDVIAWLADGARS